MFKQNLSPHLRFLWKIEVFCFSFCKFSISTQFFKFETVAWKTIFFFFDKMERYIFKRSLQTQNFSKGHETNDFPFKLKSKSAEIIQLKYMKIFVWGEFFRFVLETHLQNFYIYSFWYFRSHNSLSPGIFKKMFKNLS